MENAWLIPAFPFTGFLINGLFGYRLKRIFSGCIACTAMALSFAYALALFLGPLPAELPLEAFERNYFTWIEAGTLKVAFGLLIDPLSLLMVLVVTGVGFLIHVYSIGYMHDDPGFSRYFAYLNLFAAAMLLLVLANNFLLLFVGWEGVGLCSYLLIGFWYEKQAATDAGKKAFIVNRIGDFGFLLAIFLIFWTFGSLDFQVVMAAAPDLFPAGAPTLTAITLLLFLGAIGKSAQLPLYVWLPDAMEGPTPVSALIHAATMVTAGVYMVARCSVLYALAPFALGLVAAVGCATAVYAATIGLVQNDIKRVLAYSTVSQLGYMFLGCGVGAFVAGIFHLMTHAFFKALLFLGSGSVIHALHGEQDLRRMGGLKARLPLTYWTFMAGTLALCGIVPFAGFFSKDEILWEAFAGGHPLLYGLALFGALLTAFYMFRLVFLTFHGTPRAGAETMAKVHESPRTMTIPLIVLAVLALVGGWVQVPLVAAGKRLGAYLAPVFEKAEHLLAAGRPLQHAGAWQEGLLMGLSLAAAIAGIAFAYRLYLARPQLPNRIAERFGACYRLLLNKYYVDEFYQSALVEPLRRLAEGLWRGIDVRVIDGAVNGCAQLAIALSGRLRRLQTGYVHHYAWTVVAGACGFFVYILSR